MFAFILSRLAKESEKTTNFANENACFYNVLIPELFFFLKSETIQRSRNLLIINFGKDTRNCILSTSLLSSV